MPLSRKELLLLRIDYNANLPRCKVLRSVSSPGVYCCLEPGHPDSKHATRSGRDLLEWSRVSLVPPALGHPPAN